jgi:gamma-glutamylcyclotransferase (GGCT)/AIG2-like uncharacterized protein YtfP
MHTYFAYGSNLNRAQFARRCPGSRPLCRAVLKGYRFSFRGHGHADIVRDKRSEVWGALYEITDRDAAALDRYEGVPTYYVRVDVFVEDDQGEVRLALAYKMAPHHRPADPSPGYVQTILEGYRDWGLAPDREVEDVLRSFEQR